MFKISHRQNVIRASVIGCLIVAVLSVAAYFIINQFGISRAAINPGDTVTIKKKPDTEVYRYGSKRESGHEYDGSMTRWYRVVAPDGTKYDGFCAQASNDDPRDKNKPAVEISRALWY